jgi:hypothetical protein
MLSPKRLVWELLSVYEMMEKEQVKREDEGPGAELS